MSRRALLQTLRRLGYAADEASNGRQGLEALQRVSYPLVLMDCEMPILDGYQTAAEIRRAEAGQRRTVLIAVTGHALAVQRKRILAAGMDDCIAKPVDLDHLSELLARWWPRADVAAAVEDHPSGVISTPPEELPLDPQVRRSKEIICVFLKHAPAQLGAVEQALRAGDHEALRRAAHTLKGSCLALGAPRMASLSAALEKSPPDRETLYLALDSEAARVRAALEAAAHE